MITEQFVYEEIILEVSALTVLVYGIISKNVTSSKIEQRAWLIELRKSIESKSHLLQRLPLTMYV